MVHEPYVITANMNVHVHASLLFALVGVLENSMQYPPYTSHMQNGLNYNINKKKGQKKKNY